ncbi:MAG TPA: hypothetical protein PLG98_12180, partial [Smithella sp.]|nr:hypothetical protein [Smithella sp.]
GRGHERGLPVPPLRRRGMILSCGEIRYKSMMETVFQQFNIWAQPNDTLRRLCAINQDAVYN